MSRNMPNRRNTRKNRLLSKATGFVGRILRTAGHTVGNVATTAVNVAKGALNGTTMGVTRAINRTARNVEGAFGKLASRKNRKHGGSRKHRKNSRRSNRH